LRYGSNKNIGFDILLGGSYNSARV